MTHQISFIKNQSQTIVSQMVRIFCFLFLYHYVQQLQNEVDVMYLCTILISPDLVIMLKICILVLITLPIGNFKDWGVGSMC